VLHIDGDSSDQTLALSARFKKKLKLKSFNVKKRNVNYQRNFGIKKAGGEWLIFIDADSRLQSNFLQKLKSLVERVQNDKTKINRTLADQDQISPPPQDNFQLFTTWINAETPNLGDKIMTRFINFYFDLFFWLGKPVAFGAMFGVHQQVAKIISFNENQKMFEEGYFIQAANRLGFKFKILHEPTFTCSMRRVRQDGKLRVALIMARGTLLYLVGYKFTNQDEGYQMEGGTYYHKE
jgi:glycosyltransferase involved in cell wall biosynthesis